MSLKKILSNPAVKDHTKIEMSEEWNNFIQRVGVVSGLVKDMASGDKNKADAAQALVDKYLQGKVILDEDIKITIKQDRTLVNQKAFQAMENNNTVCNYNTLISIMLCKFLYLWR